MQKGKNPWKDKDIREAAELCPAYQAKRDIYTARNELPQLILFDCALDYTPGAFDQLKGLVNQYAAGGISADVFHTNVCILCAEACIPGHPGGPTLASYVFNEEFHLLLAGMTIEKEMAALRVHIDWLSE
jgi:glycine cleavage system protein P-like pyridoxal-binding family